MFEYPEYNQEDVYNDVKKIVPEDFISTNIFERINNNTTPLAFDMERAKLPYLVVRPGSTKEVSELMKYANSKGIPVYPRGSGNSLAGASRYWYKGIVLNMSRFNFLRIDKENGYFEGGPGATGGYINQELAKLGYFLPMMPGSVNYASLGGMVNTNTSGHILDCTRGKPSDHVMGVEAVLPTGDVLETGTKSLRRPSGTDLTKFFAGGDGLLGIITMARVRMLPLPKNSYGLAYFKDLEPLARAIQAMYWEDAPLPLCTELLDKRCGDIGLPLVGLEPPPGPLFMWESIGKTEEEASSNCDKVSEVIESQKPIELKKIDLEHWQKLWLARGQIYPYVSRQGFSVLSEVVSPVAELVNMLDEVIHFQRGMPTLEELGDGYLFGHIGALAFHNAYPLPPEWPAEKRMRAQREMFMKESILNTKYGVCGGEWGQFSIRAPFFVSRYGEKAYELVKAMKGVFDPNNILNPGVLEGTMAGENWEGYKFKPQTQ